MGGRQHVAQRGGRPLETGQARSGMAKYEEAQKMRKKDLGSEHACVGDTVNDLANVLEAQEKPDEGMPAFGVRIRVGGAEDNEEELRTEARERRRWQRTQHENNGEKNKNENKKTHGKSW